MTELILGLGIVGALVFHELAGVSPGGVVAPAYVAFYLDQPARVAGTLLVSLVTFALVNAAGRMTLLYGRRKYGSMLLVGFICQWVWGRVILPLAPASGLDAIGLIVPGLIANEIDRQGLLPTWVGLLIVAAFVRLAMLALIGLGWL